MLEVVSVLTSFHRNHARIKMLRVSISVIRSGAQVQARLLGYVGCVLRLMREDC